jgi:NAD(P)-dependent dehydrogenase (short-subunit alcohol dehydrogenase family)
MSRLARKTALVTGAARGIGAAIAQAFVREAAMASDEAAYITGTEITIDGGILAGAAAPPGRSSDAG